MTTRLIYREEQSFRQSFIPWIMLVAILFVMGGVSLSFYQQLYLGRPYGNEPMSNNGLIGSSIISFVVMTAAFILILGGRMVTEIWTDGIRFNFSPFIRKMRHIPLADITSVEVAKYKPVLEFGGWGLRKRLLSRKTAYNISGRVGVRVIKKNGSQVMLGTQKQEEMKRAVDKMLAGTPDNYITVNLKNNEKTDNNFILYNDSSTFRYSSRYYRPVERNFASSWYSVKSGL